MKRHKGLTIVELLVVIGIIVLLLSILIPVVTRARNSAMEVQCLANVRSLTQAVLAYAGDNDRMLPRPNLMSAENQLIPGWLYRQPLSADPAAVETGTLWKYVNKREVYHCPQDVSPYNGGLAHTLSSFLMNNAVLAYGKRQAPYRLAQMPPNGILFSEVASAGANASPFSDGEFSPDSAPTDRHGSGRGKPGAAAVGCFDGHCERLKGGTATDKEPYYDEQNPPAGQPSRLWCNPQTPDGH